MNFVKTFPDINHNEFLLILYLDHLNTRIHL